MIGRGSYMTDTGEVEMDASIMDGTKMKAGGVTLVKNILTPVKLSRLVMEKVKCTLFDTFTSIYLTSDVLFT